MRSGGESRDETDTESESLSTLSRSSATRTSRIEGPARPAGGRISSIDTPRETRGDDTPQRDEIARCERVGAGSRGPRVICASYQVQPISIRNQKRSARATPPSGGTRCAAARVRRYVSPRSRGAGVKHREGVPPAALATGMRVALPPHAHANIDIQNPTAALQLSTSCPHHGPLLGFSTAWHHASLFVSFSISAFCSASTRSSESFCVFSRSSSAFFSLMMACSSTCLRFRTSFS